MPSLRQSPLPARSRRARGFTLIEAMVAVSIIVIVTALAATGVIYGLNRARANNATFEVVSLLTLAQTRATATGQPHYVALWEQSNPADGGRAHSGAVLFTLPAGTAEPAWPDQNWLEPEGFGATVVERVRLERGEQVRFLPLGTAGLGAGALPAPFGAVSVAPKGSAGLLAACSFCEAGSAAVGVLRFVGTGEVDARTAVATTTGGGAFAVGEGTVNTTTNTRARLVAIATPTGAIKVYER